MTLSQFRPYSSARHLASVVMQGDYSAEAAAITGARVTYHRKKQTDPGSAFFKPGDHWS
jgi:hypothetical protein